MRKGLLGFAILTGAALVWVTNFAEAETVLTCKGQWSSHGHDTVYMALRQYRWPVTMWAESDGNAMIQYYEATEQRYIRSVRRIQGGTLAVYEFIGGDGGVIGGYRAGPSELEYSVTTETIFGAFKSTFSGRCKPYSAT